MEPVSSEPAAYKIKRTTFLGRDVPIFMQNNNGPCPLLAIANILSLRNQLNIPASGAELTQHRLVSTIAERILDLNKHSDDNSEYSADIRQNISDCLEVLGKLATGIDVNVKFTDNCDFEPTKENLVFDLLDISLVHGWLVDPQDEVTAEVVKKKSYNELVEFLISATDATAATKPQVPVAFQSESAATVQTVSHENPTDNAEARPRDGSDAVEDVIKSLVNDIIAEVIHANTENDPKQTVEPEPASPPAPAPAPAPSGHSEQFARKLYEADVVRLFLDKNCSQLTVYGLAKLVERLNNNQLAVFFRNNHFSTIFKYNQALYLLVTDQGYLSVPGVMWERLDNVEGDTQLCDTEFVPFKSPKEQELLPVIPPDDQAPPVDVDADADLALALHLQEQEEYELRQAEDRRRQQQREQEQQQQQQIAAEQERQHQALLRQREQQQAAQQQAQRQQQQARQSPGSQRSPGTTATRPARSSTPPTAEKDKDKCCVM